MYFIRLDLLRDGGRGFEKMMDGVRRNPGNRPKYDIDDEGVMVLYEACKQYKKLLAEDTTQTTTQTKHEKTVMQKAILNIIKRSNKVTLQNIANELGKTRDGVKYHITKMQNEGVLKHIGKDNDGHWKIIN